jgi:hypothetical protein
MKEVTTKASKANSKIEQAISSELGFSAADVMVLDTSIGNLADLRKADMGVLRKATSTAAYNLLFGVFDKGTGGGDMVGSAVKACVKARNGGKPMKARTVTQAVIEKITTDEVLTALDTFRTARFAAIDGEAKARIDEKRVTDTDAAKWVETKKAEVQKAYEKAQEWLNRAWKRIPAAMNAIRALSGGSVKTVDGETKPVDLAFEMILLNRAETARQFARVVVKA